LKLLDAYIFKRFLKTWVFVIAMITMIICVVDYTEKIEDFIKRHPSTNEVLFDYYLNLIPYWANTISPLMVFISVVFMTANMAARTEIIAILSTGVSFLRFMRPYFLTAALISAFTFVMVGYVIPRANKTRIAFENKYVKGDYYFEGRDVHLKIAPTVYAYLESYNNTTNTGDRFTLERIEGNELKQKLSSDRIEWNAKKGKWTVYNYTIRHFDGPNETISHGMQLDTTLNLKPKDFESNYRLWETFTLTQLNDYIAELRLRGSDGIETYLIEKYTRFANPFSVLILTAIGVIVSARKARGGVGLQIALGFGLAFAYILFYLLSSGIAAKGSMPPLLAVWLPNITFTLIGLVLYRTIPR
jgi:lipopolysaccharide export system permease protein